MVGDLYFTKFSSFTWFNKINMLILIQCFSWVYCLVMVLLDHGCLQIVYFLFTSDLEPEEEDLQAVVDDLRERLSPRHQRLQDILVNTAKEINSGGSCIYKVCITK